MTIVGNLLDNAVDAACAAPVPWWVRLEAGSVTVDGVEELEIVVAKKDGCVHDFSLVAPAGRAEGGRQAFEKLVAGFSAERSAP